ncbi:retrotransposon protein, putative, ty1-copia subclass [Tanacetum coccineum]
MLARLVLQGLKGSRKLKHRALSLGAVSISCLVKNGYIHTFTNYGISVSKDNVFFNAISTAKHGLDSYYLWHCRLGHINKKHMDMLQRDELMQPTHDESHEKYDFSRYGFVYLMKHKHEVFETFKVFQNEVENQLGKKIKAIRSDREGEYLSHEFVNHMKSYARILNMVPTKKVDKTSYEIWHGKALKLSYLRVWGCKVLVKRDTPDKLDSRSIKCIFVGYPKETMEASGSHGLLEMSRSDKGLEIIQEEDIQPSENTSKEHNEVAPIKLISRTVRCKWLFKKKTDIDGNVHTFKARLVEKGYTQTYKADYGETLSPVADIRAIRILLAIVLDCDYEFGKYIPKTAFLNGHLSEDVYMVQPEGFDEEIKKIGFTQNPDEPCVYLKTSGSNVAFLVLYVDDILLMRNSITLLKEVKSWFCKCFSMKELGEAAYILGIKIIHDRSKPLIALSQSTYLEEILKKFRMENSKKGYTPMMEKPDYRKSQGAKTPTEVQRIQRVPYASAIGSIKYGVRCTRPDVAFANTKDMVLVYGAKPEDELKVSCYADANWEEFKQSTTAMSSTEAEYIAAAEALMEAVWMRKFIDGLGGVMPSNKRPIEMLCDNEPALAIASDPGILKGARHFQRKYHYIHEVIQEGEIILKKVHTYDNVADPVLTKPMPHQNKHFEASKSWNCSC